MIHDVNGNIPTDFTPKTIRRKPRPLSIIDERSTDTAENDVDNSTVPKIDSPDVQSRRSSRRLAVAPLQHPVIELGLSGCSDGATENPQARPTDATRGQHVSDWGVGGHEIWGSLGEHGVAILNWSVPDETAKLHQDTLSESDPDDGQYLANNDPEESDCSSSGSNVHFCERLEEYSPVTVISGDSRESTGFTGTDTDTTSPFYDSDSESPDMKKSRLPPFPTAEFRKVSRLDDIREEEQTSAKRDLDKDQKSWQKRVKGSVSVTSLPDKFRPLRNSFSSFGSGNFSPRNGIVAKRDHGPSEFSGHGDSARFSLAGQRNSPDYLRNPNSVVTLHPKQLKDSQEPRKLKDVVQRRSSWHGSQSSRVVQNTEDIDAMRKEYLARFTAASPVLQHVALTTDQTPESEPTAKSGHQVLSERIQVNDSENVLGVEPKTRRISAVDQTDYFALKETTNRLRLSTRRASTLAWKAQYGGSTDENLARITLLLNRPNCSPDKKPLTKERFDRVDQSLAMLRHELINIRHQDQDLAKQFLEIRRTMGKLRFAAQCKTHDELLEEAEEDIEDFRDMSRLVDLPSPAVDRISPVTFLKHFGVTRMNISSRRFSTC